MGSTLLLSTNRIDSSTKVVSSCPPPTPSDTGYDFWHTGDNVYMPLDQRLE
jgi:hypothetical protein